MCSWDRERQTVRSLLTSSVLQNHQRTVPSGQLGAHPWPITREAGVGKLQIQGHPELTMKPYLRKQLHPKDKRDQQWKSPSLMGWYYVHASRGSQHLHTALSHGVSLLALAGQGGCKHRLLFLEVFDLYGFFYIVLNRFQCVFLKLFNVMRFPFLAELCIEVSGKSTDSLRIFDYIFVLGPILVSSFLD